MTLMVLIGSVPSRLVSQAVPEVVIPNVVMVMKDLNYIGCDRRWSIPELFTMIMQRYKDQGERLKELLSLIPWLRLTTHEAGIDKTVIIHICDRANDDLPALRADHLSLLVPNRGVVVPSISRPAVLPGHAPTRLCSGSHSL